nr:hypothetical protein [uncultured Desulfobacter sp.]
MNERGQRLLIRLYAKTGQPGVAVRQYEKCKTRLALELAKTIMDCFSHGVFFIGMAGLRSPDELEGELVKVLELASDKRNLGCSCPFSFRRPKGQAGCEIQQR